ncbi:MAG: hypothetical protein IPP74_14445 [Alphaproteobacteria bacterium]|nr:hypothetical protein [Alphaproteobacteria bacterium]
MSELTIGKSSRIEKAIASVQKDTKIIRMNIILEKKMHNKIKMAAMYLETNVTTLVKNAVNEYISKYAPEHM